MAARTFEVELDEFKKIVQEHHCGGHEPLVRDALRWLEYNYPGELADTMWNNCGIWRIQRDLLTARTKLDELAERARKCDLLDDSGWANQAVPFTRALINMIEQSKAILGGAITRDESRGAHFKMDTPDRDDKNWLKTTLATWTPTGPAFEYEPIDTRYISPRPRKYRINQNKIVKEIMGEDALKGIGEEVAAKGGVGETGSR